MVTSSFLKYLSSKVLLAIGVILIATQSDAQVTIGFQGGEAGDSWTFSSTGASAIATSEATATANKITGTKSLVVGGNTGGGNCFASGTGNGPDVARTYTFDPLDISTSTNFSRTLTFSWGNRYPICSGTGWEGGEDLIFQAVLDGVAQPSAILATGNNNANFDIHSHSYSYTIPTCVTSFYFTLSVTTNRADELLFLDDVKVTTPQLNTAVSGPSAITGPVTVCSGTSSSYSVNAISGISFVWSGLPSGTSFTSTNGTPNSNTMVINWGTATPGNYTISVSTLDACGNASTPQTLQVQVVAGPAAPVISGPTSICNGESAQLSSSISNNITWSTGETTQVITINTPGTYTVTYAASCGNSVGSITVGTSPGPQITGVSTTDVSCSGGSDGSLTINTVGSNLQYSLNGSAYQASNIFSSLGAGTYAISVQSSGGCVSTTSATINEGNALGVSITPGNSFCAGQTGSLTGNVSAAGSYSYSWTGPNGYSSNVQNPNDLTESGSYILTVSGNSCNASATVDIHFGDAPIASFVNDVVCYGNETTFSSTGSSVTAPDAINAWLWDFGDGNFSTQENPVHQYSASGVFPATLTVTSSSGCSADLTLDIEVMAKPIANFTYSPGLISVSDPTVQFTNTSQSADNYFWYFGMEDSTSIETSPTFVYPQEEGAYTVILIASSANGCQDSIKKNITVGNGLVYYIPNSFTPNQDGINDEFLPVFTSGLDEANYRLTIFNRWGESIFDSKELTKGWNGTYQNLMVPDGTYVWQIIFKHKENDVFQSIDGHVTVFK